jgi:hypothetical protein
MSLSEAELKELIFVAYACSKISTVRACEILNLDLLAFRWQWNDWAKLNPKMKQIFDDLQYEQFRTNQCGKHSKNLGCFDENTQRD